jgi:hypothetical protein
MKNARGQRRIGPSAPEHVDEMIHGARTSRGDHRNADGLTYSSGKFAIKSRSRAVGVHRCEQDFTCAPSLSLARPLHNAAASVLASALHKHLRVANWVCGFRIAAGIDGHDNSLRSKASANGVNQRWVGKRCGVDADFVGAGLEDLRRISRCANTAANTEWDE